MRMKQKKVWILSGCPGSGKTTWVHKMLLQTGGVHCSRDEVRFSLLKDDEDYFARENEVFALWIEKIAAAIKNPEVEHIYVDATHLNDKSRKKVIDALPKGEYEICFIVFDVPLETCLEQNELRQNEGRSYVPKSVIRRMYASFDKTTKLNYDVLILGKDDV